MKTVFLICEFNPFHSGHARLMKMVKEKYPGCLLICLMSGSFTQRGLPAVCDRWTRAKMALLGGADVVLELPYLFAVQGAAQFAQGAVRIADAFGADHLAFGAETEDPQLLEKAALMLSEESGSLSGRIRRLHAAGHNAGAARQAALAREDPALAALFSHPNNILGVEYLRAIHTLPSDMSPFIVRRENGPAAHHIRRDLLQAADSTARQAIFRKAGVPIPFEPSATEDILYHLAAAAIRLADPETLCAHPDIPPAAASRICSAAKAAPDYTAFLDLAQTRWLTRARLRRALLNICIGAKRHEAEAAHAPESPLHTRLLGLRASRRADYGRRKKSTALPVISSYRQYPDTVLAKYDKRAAELYHCLKTPAEDARADHAHPVIVL